MIQFSCIKTQRNTSNEIVKAEQIIHKTRSDNGKTWLVFAQVIDYGIKVGQHGFMFYTKKKQKNFVYNIKVCYNFA